MKYRTIALFACTFFILGPATAKAGTFDYEIKPSGEDNFPKATFRFWLDDANKPAPADTGWFGDLSTKTVKPAAGSPRELGARLPHETSAKAWKSFVTY